MSLSVSEVETIMVLKALVIRDDKHKFKDLEDVVKVARALGQQAFKTRENVLVKKIWGPDPSFGYVVLVESRTNRPDVRLRKGVGNG